MTENAQQTNDSFYVRARLAREKEPPNVLVRTSSGFRHAAEKEKAHFAFRRFTLSERVYAIVMASLSALSSRVAHQARFGSKAHRRVTAGRGVRASALPQKGRPALTMVMRVPSAKESEVDALFASHEALMHDTHVIGEAEADDIGHPRMLEYYVAKSTELSDPLDAGTSRVHPRTAIPRGI